ncbi:hypothetical protein EJ06DRAFT_533057, partial [Trichodelitschia bisporula]
MGGVTRNEAVIWAFCGAWGGCMVAVVIPKAWWEYQGGGHDQRRDGGDVRRPEHGPLKAAYASGAALHV